MSETQTESGSRPRARPWLILVPAACAAAYPWLLAGDLFLARAADAAPPATVALATVLSLIAASCVVGFALVTCRRSGDLPVRLICHFAAATPTLYVGVMNYARLFGASAALNQIWLALWLIAAGGAFALSRRNAAPPPRRRQSLATLHGICAAAILTLFLAPHIANHLAGLWSGPSHIAFMEAIRLAYRNAVIEPLLFVLVAFQIVSGLVLAAPRLCLRMPWLGTLQSISGVYVGVFFLGHIVPVFSARFAGTDTNWNWLTANDAGLIANLSRIYLVPHYWVGVIALAAHLACGLRDVLIKHGGSSARVDRGAYAAIGLGAAVSTAILLGLLGMHLAAADASTT